MDSIYTYCVGLPDQINEMVVPCADGYTIYINEKLDQDARVRAYNHAVSHIASEDWKRSDVQVIEGDRHGR